MDVPLLGVPVDDHGGLAAQREDVLRVLRGLGLGAATRGRQLAAVHFGWDFMFSSGIQTHEEAVSCVKQESWMNRFSEDKRMRIW